MIAKPNNPYDALIHNIRELGLRELEGLPLWRQFVAESHQPLIEIARSMAWRRSPRRLDPHDVLNEAVATLSLQFWRAGERGCRGNAVFGNFDPKRGELALFLTRRVCAELGWAVCRLLRPRNPKARTVTLSDEVLLSLTVEDDRADDRLDAADRMTVLNALPDELREVLVMRYLRDLTPEEIAEELSISRTTAYERLVKARKAMRDLLPPEGRTDPNDRD